MDLLLPAAEAPAGGGPGAAAQRRVPVAEAGDRGHGQGAPRRARWRRLRPPRQRPHLLRPLQPQSLHARRALPRHQGRVGGGGGGQARGGAHRRALRLQRHVALHQPRHCQVPREHRGGVRHLPERAHLLRRDHQRAARARRQARPALPGHLSSRRVQLRGSAEDLEKERGAVMEYKGGRNAAGRMQDSHWALLFEGSKNACR